MRFELDQRINKPAEQVAGVFVDPRFYDLLDTLPNLGRPEVLTHDVDGSSAHLRIRYRFTGHLSSAVRAAVDPEKLTWVEDTQHDLATHSARFTMVADHYADRFQCAGTYRFDAVSPTTTTRICAGDLRIRMPLVGHRVEKAIVSGLREHLEAEGAVVERFLTQSTG
jgi:hypothetical protein